jgi:hypothetical protein
MNLLRLIGGRTASAPVARERCRFFWRTNADCAAGLICWKCCGQKSLLWYRDISCLIRKRSSSGWIGASMSRRLKSILRCLPVSRDRTRSLLDDRRQRQRRPLARIQLRKSRSATKALEIARSRIGVTRPLTNATWPAVVAWSSSADCRPVHSRRTADVH